MILGYSSNAFTEYSVFEAVKLISELGFGGIEIMCDRPHVYPLDFTEEQLRCLMGAIETHNLKITNLNSFTLFAVGDTYLPSWIERQKERRQIRIDHTLRCLQLAERLGCKNISVPPGGPPNGMSSRHEDLKRFHEGLEQVVPFAEERGIKVLVEPEPGLLIENSRQFSEFIKAMKSPAVGLNFDVGHFFCAGEDPAVVFQELFQWIGHVHLEDIAENRVHRHLIPGRGAVDFLKVFESMRVTGYTGNISLELYPYADRPVEAGREGLRHILPFLKEACLKLEN